MELEEYMIVKLYDKLDCKEVYVAILRIKEDVLKVKVLKQPSYNLINKRSSDSIFKQNCHEDDEVCSLPLNYDIDDMTFNVHVNMCEELSKNELIILLKHLTYTNFTRTLNNQAIFSEALDRLIQ